MLKSLCRIFVLAAAALVTVSCASEKANNCPAVSSLVETSIATVFKSTTSTDPANILYTVEVVQVHGSCSVDKQANNSSSSVDITFRATRGPSGAAATYKVPYFVAISQSDRILAKKIYSVDVAFAPGETTATVTDTIDQANVNAGKDLKTFDYMILVGLQLTKEQLQYNRTSGRLAP